ncbi:MAG: glycosyltransferase [Gelidibacter sp.]
MKKERMVFVTNLHFSPNGNGGQQRTYFLIKELSLNFDLIVISPYKANEPEIKDVNADFIENKGVLARKWMQQSFLGRLVTKLATILLKLKSSHSNPVKYYSSLQLVKQIKNIKKDKRYNNAEIIVFDTVRTVEKLNKSLFKKRILNAHNFDSEIYEYELEQLKNKNVSPVGILDKSRELKFVQSFEHHIDSYFDVIWTCSNEDIKKFKEHNPKTNVKFECLPNGSDTESRKLQKINHNYQKLLFVGSLNYFPNVNGLRWFVKSILSKVPNDFELTIVGKSPKAEDFDFIKPFANIKLIGEVDDVEPYYALNDVVVVPLLEGSGTRLKIMEAFSYGKLVLSTAKGMEGISAVDGKHYIQFEDFNDFETKYLVDLKNGTFESLRKQARLLVENHYSWKGIVSDYSKKLYGT